MERSVYVASVGTHLITVHFAGTPQQPCINNACYMLQVTCLAHTDSIKSVHG
eukprot:m.1672279 g.1672279  ORF g.1672279 m.1672279 type:complete len:52 (+) comp173012_c0_seq1:65-220(+)